MKNFLYGTIIFLQLVQLNFLPLLSSQSMLMINMQYHEKINYNIVEKQALKS
jgi:hypothetical protein